MSHWMPWNMVMQVASWSMPWYAPEGTTDCLAEGTAFRILAMSSGAMLMMSAARLALHCMT